VDLADETEGEREGLEAGEAVVERRHVVHDLPDVPGVAREPYRSGLALFQIDE